MLRSACAISNDRPNGTSTFSGSSDFMMACGTACRLLLAKEIPGSPCSPRTRSRKRPRTAKFECFIWRFARTGKISSVRSSELEEARNQIRIPGSRDRALDLFPRSRRPPARDYDVRRRVARCIRTVSLSQRKKHKNCRGRVSVIPSAVEESLANFSDNACVSNFERCLDFARHDKERRLRPAFGIERRIGRINR